MNYITKKHISRRQVLRGAGGIAIALPLLDAMLPASSAWAQEAAKPRPRYAAIYIPHGKTMAKWTPKSEGRDFEFTEILKPLEGHRERLNVISGLRLQTGYVYHYAFAMLIGVALLITYFMFAGGVR